MGLTIHYKLSVAENLPFAVVRELVSRAGLYAKKVGCVEVSDVTRVEAYTPFTKLFVSAGREEDDCFSLIPAKRGWVVEVWPGEGCESAHLGLCQYRRRVPYMLHGRYGSVRTDYTGGWLFKGGCKTQYASEHGWEHFLRCHKMILSILNFWRQMDVNVEVNDEGGYWETGSEKKLRDTLQGYNGLIAALAGAFKDAGEASGKGGSVESPIFAHGDFERLEAQGWQEFGKQLSHFRLAS